MQGKLVKLVKLPLMCCSYTPIFFKVYLILLYSLKNNERDIVPLVY